MFIQKLPFSNEKGKRKYGWLVFIVSDNSPGFWAMTGSLCRQCPTYWGAVILCHSPGPHLPYLSRSVTIPVSVCQLDWLVSGPWQNLGQAPMWFLQIKWNSFRFQSDKSIEFLFTLLIFPAQLIHASIVTEFSASLLTRVSIYNSAFYRVENIFLILGASGYRCRGNLCWSRNEEARLFYFRQRCVSLSIS